METPKQPPAFTQYTPCPICSGSGMQTCGMCKGRGWKQKLGGYSIIICPICYGKKKTICETCRGKNMLPEWDTDGRWQKKHVVGGMKS